MVTVFPSAARIAASLSLVLFSFSGVSFGESTPSPAVLITDTAAQALLIADPKDNHIVASIPVGMGPHEIAVSPDSKLAMVSNFQGGNSISLIDLKEQKEIHRYQFNFPARPNSLVYVDGKFYFTAEDADLVGRYDPATNNVDAMIGTGQVTGHVIMYNPMDKSLIVAARNSDTVSFIDNVMIEYRGTSRPNWKVTPVPGVHFNEAMDISPDGTTLWVSEFRGNKVAIIDLKTRTVKERFEVPNMASDRLKFTKDGKRVLLSDIERGELVAIDTTTHKEIKRVKLGQGLEGLSLTADGTTAYAVTPMDKAVAVIDVKTLEVTGHIPAKSPLSAVWIP